MTIPNSVTSIGNTAFMHCSRLTSITIPSSVTQIGERVFNDCGNLTDIYYSRNESQWNQITIQSSTLDESTNALYTANIHYNS